MKAKLHGIKTAAEHQRGELVKDVLRLVGLGVIGVPTYSAPNTAQILQFLDPKNDRQKKKIWNIVRYLEKRGDVYIKEESGHAYVYLSAKGKLRLNSDTIWQLQLTEPRRWDKKWRIVMFDFPTRTRSRHEFRSKLEDFGFQMYQRSVFIYPHECRDEVFMVAKWLKVHQHIRYIVAEEIHDMPKYIRLFDLA